MLPAILASSIILISILSLPLTTYAPQRVHSLLSQYAAVATVTPASVTTEVVTEPPQTVTETFNTVFALEEARSLQASPNSSWWVSSGAYFYSTGEYGRTVFGDLPSDDHRRLRYEDTNPVDTDQGYHPQNIFRLVHKSVWEDFRQQVYFMINADHVSDSPFRNSSNGVLFFNRYQDEFNLYYTGIRVDGHVTIKKKVNGTYYTLSYKPFLTTDQYDRESNPSLLPKDTWIGLRSEVQTNPDKSVTIRLYVDIGRTGNWVLATEATDNGSQFGGTILPEGHTGIRTDFMDVQFDDYQVQEL